MRKIFTGKGTEVFAMAKAMSRIVSDAFAHGNDEFLEYALCATSDRNIELLSAIATGRVNSLEGVEQTYALALMKHYTRFLAEGGEE